MDESSVHIFISYHRKDDESYHGIVGYLAELLRGRFSAQTGAELEVFLDREMLGGEEWEERIPEEIRRTNIFVPLITMNYFNRDHCVKELNQFLEQTSPDSQKATILPVVLAGKQYITGTSQKAEVRAIARLNWRDASEAVLKGRGSEAWERLIHELVGDLQAYWIARLSRDSVGDEEQPDGPDRTEASKEPASPGDETPPTAERRLAADGPSPAGDGPSAVGQNPAEDRRPVVERLPAGIASAGVGSGPEDLVFAACLDRTGGLWWSPIGVTGPRRWQEVPHPGVQLVSLAATTNDAAGTGRSFREIFAVTTQGRLWHTWSLDDGWTWEVDQPQNAWEDQAGFPEDVAAITAGSAGSGHVEIFAVTADGGLQHRWWNSPDGWSSWTGMTWAPDGSRAQRVCFAGERNPHPWRSHLFIVDTLGRAWHRPWIGREGRWWQSARLLPDPPGQFTDVVAASRTAGHLELFALTTEGKQYSTWSSDAGDTWADWFSWPGTWMGGRLGAGATQSAEASVAVHHHLSIGHWGTLDYSRYEGRLGRWRGPFRVIESLEEPKWRLTSRVPLTPRLDNIVAEFGVDADPGAVDRFEGPHGRPKAIVQSSEGTFFLGSLAEQWPRRDTLDWLLPRLNGIADRLERGGVWARLPKYRPTVRPEAPSQPGVIPPTWWRTHDPTSASEWVVTSGHNYFLRTFVRGRTAVYPKDIQAIAFAIGEFHMVARQLVEPADPRDSSAGALEWFAIPKLEELSRSSRCEPVLERLGRIHRDLAAAIDGLPATITHNDLQPANVLLDGDRVWLIDIEQASVQSRLYDLYFLLMGDDHGSGLGNWEAFERAAAIYQATGGAFSDTERDLLPSVLQVTAGGVAAWAADARDKVPRKLRGTLADVHETALEAILFIDANADRVRDAAR